MERIRNKIRNTARQIKRIIGITSFIFKIFSNWISGLEALRSIHPYSWNLFRRKNGGQRQFFNTAVSIL